MTRTFSCFLTKSPSQSSSIGYAPIFMKETAVRQQFLDIGCPDPACNDCGLSADLEPVEPRFDKPLPDRRLFFVEFFVQDTGMGRDHDILPGVLVELPFPQARNFGTQLHVTFRMADAGRGPEEHREPELLGKFER